MVVAHHSRDLPRPIRELPEVNEPALAHAHLGLVSGMVKAMHARFERAVAFHIKHLHTHQLARRLPADVFLHRVGERLRAYGDAALIVIELDTINEE